MYDAMAAATISGRRRCASASCARASIDPGGLYVLISPFTFSAAQNPTTRLERDSFALFVGEPTGGAPNHFGDARPFVGEASGLTSIVSTLPWFDSYPQDTRPWILPDLSAPVTFVDARGGVDRALEIAITHTTEATADELSRERVFYYERESQAGRLASVLARLKVRRDQFGDLFQFGDL